MASTFSPLKIELIGTGEKVGTWGTTTNINLGTALEEAITGSADVTFASGTVTLTLTDVNTTQTARNLRLNLIGTSGGAQNLIVPAIEKLYLINNACADTITVKNSTGTGVAVAAGTSTFVFNNGTNVVAAITATPTTIPNLTGDVTSVGTTTTLTNAPVIAKVLTGFSSTTGTVAAADSILTAFNKTTGNIALKSNTASPTFTGTVTLPTLVGSATTDATSSVTGAFKTAGGLGVAKQLWVGTNADVGGTLAVTGLASMYAGATFIGGVNAASSIWYGATNGLQIRGGTGSAYDFALVAAAGGLMLANPTGTAHLGIGGSFGRGARVTKTADFTVAATENWLANNKSGSTCTITLPSGPGYVGREIMITNYQAQLVVSASSNIVAIDNTGPSTAILPATIGKWATLVYNGTNWNISQSN